MKKIKCYIRTNMKENEYLICNEITNEVYASTKLQYIAVLIKERIEEYLNI